MSGYHNDDEASGVFWVIFSPLAVAVALGYVFWQQPELRLAIGLALGATALVIVGVAFLLLTSGANAEGRPQPEDEPS